MRREFTEQEVMVYQMRIGGLTFKSIGEQINVSRSRAREIYQKYKVKEKYTSVAEDYRNGETIENIARKYGYPTSTVQSIAMKTQTKK